ncbi:hypothetical protein Bca52824_004090 [Brassica carinata]|uniref:TF-B3 domain-containing protein n=1 Tax=Brassica carinata TaxID=52824 RepID=A0A8X7WQ01_BRACI|nr:hypothetical protein Bca52824_004090 [Brassica carinata]
MAETSNAGLSLAPPDPWVLKKKLTDTDLISGGQLILRKGDFESFIMPEMDDVTLQNMGSTNGAEVKIHIVEEGPEADDYTVTLIKKAKYLFKAGWSNMAKAKDYKTGDEIGLMWDKSSGRFLLHHIK